MDIYQVVSPRNKSEIREANLTALESIHSKNCNFDLILPITKEIRFLSRTQADIAYAKLCKMFMFGILAMFLDINVAIFNFVL